PCPFSGFSLLLPTIFTTHFAPTDYHFFQALDHFLQGNIFNSEQAVKNAFRGFIVTRFSGFFTAGMNKLPLRWQNCVDTFLGAYF
ncbi:Histone-lysine N-methyltransferase SETMAR, partial [Harpegnathos saltator]